MKKNKGFTLIELLAVIVILGLLMAIAIPSVTKYITESRKKTVTTTVGNYIGALVNEVNDLAYTFTGQNTIYAVPIECISLERGGTSPFGEWMQANDSYWAYVLIQYDDQNSKYVYGFTFKDSAGYGLYPTIQSNIKEKGSQIKTGLDLNRPVSGDLTSLTTLAKWQQSGFDVDSTTDFKVLEATSEGELGNGETTCTLCQKGKNYAQVEEEKANSNEAYAIYTESDQTLTFVRSTTEIKVGDVYDGKVVTSVYTGFENTNYNEEFLPPWFNYEEENFLNIKKVIVKDSIKPLSTAYWFAWFEDCSYFDVTKLDTSNVTNMESMFMEAGEFVTTFNIVGLDNWNTSKVTNMSYMFQVAGDEATTFDIGDLSNWDTAMVTNMSYMFQGIGVETKVFNIGDLSNWNTAMVTNMVCMFQAASLSDVGDIKKWNVSNVTTMDSIFDNFGWGATNINMDLSNWNTLKVTNMGSMFGGVGRNATNVNINVTNMNVASVTDMSSMFNGTGRNSKTVNIIGLDNFNTSNVTTMANMFLDAGTSATTFNIGNLSGWDTQKVTMMNRMFENAGKSATWSLDCGNWNVEQVTYYIWFNKNVTSKVIPPQWKN